MSGRIGTWRSIAAATLAALIATAAHAQDPGAPGADVVVRALSLLGTPYRYGGSSPSTGFDCSGLVRHVFASAVNHDLPRRAEEIGAVGVPVSRADLQPGDLVFFNTLRRAFSHVAIYIGDGRFVHAPAGSGRVRIEGLDDRYWAARFNGARRVLGAPPRAVAATERGDRAASGGSVGLWADMSMDRPPEP